MNRNLQAAGVCRSRRHTDLSTVIVGDLGVRELPQKVASLTERQQLSLEARAKRVLIPSEDGRDLGDGPGEVLNRIQPVFHMDPINAAIRAMGLE